HYYKLTVHFIGGKELLTQLLDNKELVSNKNVKAGLDDMVLLFQYLEIFNVLDKMSFDLSLARGLDYYTGIIYEAVTEQSGQPSKQYNLLIICLFNLRHLTYLLLFNVTVNSFAFCRSGRWHTNKKKVQ